MGNEPSNIRVSISNKYDRTVYTKIDHEKKYVTSSEYRAGVEAEGAGFGGKVNVEGASEWDWHKIEANFTRIPINGYQNFDLQLSKESKQFFITVLSESGKVLCESLPRFQVCNMIVALSGNLCEAKEGSRWEFDDPDQAGIRSGDAEAPREESKRSLIAELEGEGE